VAILNDIVVLGRATIVECGGGIRTRFIARALAQRGDGQLLTIEPDRRWADVLTNALVRENLQDHARVVHAPLADHPLASDTDWYRDEAVRAAQPAAPIDLLLVDGPIANRPESAHARYTAMPVFRDRLARDATVVLDHITRRGEREVLVRWEQETDLRFERRFAHGGIATGRPLGYVPLGI
jgi:predicted O-methyltransferase YrrM